MTALDFNIVYPFVRVRPTTGPARIAVAFAAPEICVVVPTFNERGNIDELVTRIGAGLAGVQWEMIVVDDDSPDGTADHVRALHRRDPRIRVIRRIGRRGLSSACLEGMLASSARLFAVIDADLQHDPALLRDMVETLRTDKVDLVCASRHVEGGSIGAWSQHRATSSRLANWAARAVTAVELSDPMSGYFAVRREVIDRVAPRLSGIGFKILLDIVLSAGAELRVREIPLSFGFRAHGESKLSPRVIWDYCMMLADHCTGGRLPLSLLSYGPIAAIALTLHMLCLWLFGDLYGLGLAPAQAIAAVGACIMTYCANEMLSYQRRGSWRWYLGLPPFLGSCALGLAGSVMLAIWLAQHGAGWFTAGFGGALIGLWWNYGAADRHGWSSAR